MSWYLRVLSEFFTFLSDKMFYQLFFFNLVERKVRLFTNKQEFLTLLHLMSFGQFQNLSEETWSRVAENLFELCFVAFLATKVRNISYSFEYCSRLQKLSRYRFCITLYMLSGVVEQYISYRLSYTTLLIQKLSHLRIGVMNLVQNICHKQNVFRFTVYRSFFKRLCAEKKAPHMSWTNK